MALRDLLRPAERPAAAPLTGSRLRRWRRPLVVVAVLGALIGALVGWESFSLYRDLQQARRELNQAKAVSDPVLVGTGSFHETEAALRGAAAHLEVAERALNRADRHARLLSPLLTLGSRLPGWPEGLSEVRPLIDQAQALTRAGLILSDGLTDLTASLDERQEGEPAGARLATGLTAAEPVFNRALAEVEQALAIRRTVEAEKLRGPLHSGASALATFDQHAASLYDNVYLLAKLPAAARVALGMEGPRTYVILGQNSNELRPTGGFIGSMGVVTLQNGEIAAEDYRSSYLFDNDARGYDPLPAPMAQRLGPGGWAVRDANWSPDFATSAQRVEHMLNHHQGIKVDGVFGFTTQAVTTMLASLGPLEVEGFDKPLTAENWYQEAERRIYFDRGEVSNDPGEAHAQLNAGKESVLEPVLRALLRRIQTANLDDMPRVMRALRTSLDQREVLLYFHDPAPAALARRYDADGRLAPPPSGDVLALVDANLSYSKANPYIRQRIVYDVTLNERGTATESRVTVSYENRLTAEEARDPRRRIGGMEYDWTLKGVRDEPGLYGTYARLYIPRNSRFTEIQSGDVPVVSQTDLGFTTLEGYFRVPTGSRTSFSYAYQIPVDRNLPGEYRLLVVKQPGATDTTLELRVHLPPGITATPSLPMTRDGDTLRYEGQLITNLDVKVVMRDE